MSLIARAPALAPFRIRSFRFQWPSDLLASWAFEMEGVILGWFVLVSTGSVLALAVFGSLQFLGTLISPAFGMVGDRIGYRNLLCLMRATYVMVALALMVLFLTGLASPVPVFVLATVIGFVVGIARLSPNWLMSRLAAVYIEIFRNIPPLLQIFFWYFAVLLPLPGPKQSMNIGDTFFLSNRGLNMPSPNAAEGYWPFIIALVLAVVAVIVLARWARQRFEATGQPFHTVYVSLAILLLVPGLSVLVFGDPFHWTVPQLTGFNFRGGWVVIPELMALTLALTIYTAAFIAENVRSGIQAVSHGQTEAARSLGTFAILQQLEWARREGLPRSAGQHTTT